MHKYVFKVILIGPGAVGKTSLLFRFVENKFMLKYKQTIGVDFTSKIVEYSENLTAKLQLWDIGGQQKYEFLRSSFFEKADGALIVFDLSREHTYYEIAHWFSEMQKYAGEIPFVLIGNKIDLIDNLEQSSEHQEAKIFAKKEGGYYIVTSAKTGISVNDAFFELTRRMTNR